MTGSSPSIEGSATRPSPRSTMPTTCCGPAAALGLFGAASSALVAIRPSLHRAWAARQTSADSSFMVIGNIHPMIGEATRRCVQHVYKHCWKCRDVACHTVSYQVATRAALFTCIPLELLKACMYDVASRNSLACRPIPASVEARFCLILVAGGRPQMVRSANRGRDTARDHGDS